MKTSETLINEIMTSETLQKQLAEAAKNNALDAFLKDQGCEADVEAFIAAIRDQGEALADTELDAVAGGMNGKEAIRSIFTAGFGCAIAAIVSTAESGVGNGPDGKLLCNNDGMDDPPLI